MSTFKLNRRDWKKCLASLDIMAICPTENRYVLEIAFFIKPQPEYSDLLYRFHEKVLDGQNVGIFYLDYSEIVFQSIEKQSKSVIKSEDKIKNFIDELFKIIPRQGVCGLVPKTQEFLKDMAFDDQYKFLRAELGKPRVIKGSLKCYMNL